jgi:hypothetical protein
VETVVEEINAELAEEYLATNPKFEIGKKGTNRPVSWNAVNNYAREMLYGNWVLTHQGIAFDHKGKLRDGQHRLYAIVEAATHGAYDGEYHLEPKPDISIQMTVTRDVDPKTFDVMDTGRTRNASQILSMSGMQNTIALAATGRLLYLFDNHEQSQWRSLKVTNHTILETVAKHRLADYWSAPSGLYEIGFIRSAAIAGYYVCKRAWPEGPHNEFLDGLKTGEMMSSEDPRLVLRNYMMKSRKESNSKRDAVYHLALYIKAWNDFARGRRRSYISWNANRESFPKPIEGPSATDDDK